MNRDELIAPCTQIVTDRDAYLGQGRHDVGRRISDDQVELFIGGDVAASLQQEFERHASEFIALHDVGTSASLKLVSSLATAAGARVQRLAIRRQGHGVALAMLQFVQMQLADGTPVRVYATDIAADAATRAQVARVLLANSHLGVLLVGPLAPHALTGQLMPLHEALLRGPWPNRELLLVPLAASAPMAAQAARLSGDSAVTVHVAPQADKPRQAWAFVAGTWNRLHAEPGGERALATEMALAVPRPLVPRSEAATEPMPLDGLAFPRSTRPAAAAPPTPMPVPGTTRWQVYAERCLLIKGSLACCVFDMHSLRPLAHAGGQPSAERLAQQGAALAAHLQDTARALALGPALVEGSVSTTGHHLLLRAVAGHPGIAVVMVLSAAQGNLTLARMQLERIEAPR